MKSKSIKKRILLKKFPFKKWISGENILTSLLISIILCLPSILSGLLVHMIDTKIILTSIISTLLFHLFFNYLIFTQLHRKVSQQQNAKKEEDKVHWKTSIYDQIPLLFQVPISLIWIYNSYVMNPFLSYSSLIIIISLIGLISNYNDYLNNKVGVVEKHEIRNYKLNKIRKKNKKLKKEKYE